MALEGKLPQERGEEGKLFYSNAISSGHVFSWGNGGNGRLGHGSHHHHDRAYEIEVRVLELCG